MSIYSKIPPIFVGLKFKLPSKEFFILNNNLKISGIKFLILLIGTLSLKEK